MIRHIMVRQRLRQDRQTHGRSETLRDAQGQTLSRSTNQYDYWPVGQARGQWGRSMRSFIITP